MINDACYAPWPLWPLCSSRRPFQGQGTPLGSWPAIEARLGEVEWLGGADILECPCCVERA